MSKRFIFRAPCGLGHNLLHSLKSLLNAVGLQNGTQTWKEVMGALEGVGSGFNQNTLDSGVKFSNNNKDTLHTYMKNFKD